MGGLKLGRGKIVQQPHALVAERRGCAREGEQEDGEVSVHDPALYPGPWQAAIPMPAIIRSASPRSLHALLALSILLASVARAAEPEKKPGPAPGSFTIENFQLESGVTLPKAVVVYGTYGTLNAAKDNAVLLPSHYMAQSDGYDWLIGEGRALDPRKHFLIMTELFGNGRSSSPSNTPEPFHGPRFPLTTIRDNVEAVRRLLEDGLGIHHLKAVVGFSMGAEQAFQWAVSHPRFADKIVATAGTARCWPHGIVRLEGADPRHHRRPGVQGRRLHRGARARHRDHRRGVAGLALLTGVVEARAMEEDRSGGGQHDPGAIHREADQGVLRRSGREQPHLADAHLAAARRGDDAGFGGSTEKALRSVSAPVLYMPSETDLYFPLGDARQESRWIRKVTLAPIPSLWGHPAGAGASPEDLAFIERKLRAFLGAP